MAECYRDAKIPAHSYPVADKGIIAEMGEDVSWIHRFPIIAKDIIRKTLAVIVLVILSVLVLKKVNHAETLIGLPACALIGLLVALF